MKKLISLISLFLLQACFIGAGENSKITASKNNFFPKITGIDLEGKKRELPESFEGKLNIVVVAFKREQQADVDTWIPSADKIVKENSGVNFYEIPLIYELGAVSRAWVNNGMRFGIKNEIARKRTITVYTKRDEFFKITKMKEEKIYVLLLDKSGKILWKSDGLANEEKIKTLNKAVKKFNR